MKQFCSSKMELAHWIYPIINFLVFQHQAINFMGDTGLDFFAVPTMLNDIENCFFMPLKFEHVDDPPNQELSLYVIDSPRR